MTPQPAPDTQIGKVIPQFDCVARSGDHQIIAGSLGIPGAGVGPTRRTGSRTCEGARPREARLLPFGSAMNTRPSLRAGT